MTDDNIASTDGTPSGSKIAPAAFYFKGKEKEALLALNDVERRIGGMNGNGSHDFALTMQGLRSAQDLCHQTSLDRGWYINPRTGLPIERNFGEVVSLMHSEISEGMEAHRKNLMDDKLPNRLGLSVELADCAIRIFDTAGSFGYEMDVPRRMQHCCIVTKAYTDDINVGESLAFMHMALSRAFFAYEGCYIKNSSSSEEMFYREVEESFAHCLALIFKLSYERNLNVPMALILKNRYNHTRQDHSLAARAAEGGKAY